MDERELFTEHFDLDPESVWTAFKRGTATMDLRDVDDVNRTARLSTGVTLNGWHDELFATVAPGASGTDLVVRGAPRTRPWARSGVRTSRLTGCRRRSVPR